MEIKLTTDYVAKEALCKATAITHMSKSWFGEEKKKVLLLHSHTFLFKEKRK